MLSTASEQKLSQIMPIIISEEDEEDEEEEDDDVLLGVNKYTAQISPDGAYHFLQF